MFFFGTFRDGCSDFASYTIFTLSVVVALREAIAPAVFLARANVSEILL
jgi:hypothetical protein